MGSELCSVKNQKMGLFPLPNLRTAKLIKRGIFFNYTSINGAVFRFGSSLFAIRLVWRQCQMNIIVATKFLVSLVNY